MDKKFDEIPEIPEIVERVRQEKKPKLLEKTVKPKSVEKKAKPVKSASVEKTEKTSGILKDALVLFAITMVAGLLLGGVYEITKKPIEEQENQAKQKAYQTVFSDGASFLEMDLDYEAGEKYLAEEGYTSNEIQSVIEVKNDTGNTLGKIYNIVSKEGYGGDIVVSLGIMDNGVICGMELLEINETAGLGMEAKNRNFLDQFLYEKASPFTYSTTGATHHYEIDAVSGATITTNAVVSAVNAGVLLDSYYASKGGSVNE